MALPASTCLEETDSDILVKLEREKLKDSDERIRGGEGGTESVEGTSPKEAEGKDGERKEGEVSAVKEEEGGEKGKEREEEVMEVDGDKEKEKEVEFDPVVLASRKPLDMDLRIGELEKTYGLLMLEKVLGLLTAVLPQETVSQREEREREVGERENFALCLCFVDIAMDTAQTRH